jgi:hypothetical protein
MDRIPWIESFRNAVAAWTGIGGRRQFLYVCADALYALQRRHGRWVVGARFSLRAESGPVEPGAAAAALVPEGFRAWLARWRGDDFHFLLDSSDEDLETEELPRVRGSDRDKIVERRIKQRFRDAALTAWFVPNGARRRAGARAADAKAKGAAAGECTIVVGLRQRNPIVQWIEAAVAAGARVAAVESLALRSAPVLRNTVAAPTALLASVQPGGLRQTLITDGEVCFTRLMPIELPASWQKVHGELDRTIRFLMMSRASLRPAIQAGKVAVVIIGAGITDDGDAASRTATLHLRELALPLTRIDPGTAGLPGAVPGLGALAHFLQPGVRARTGYATRAMRAPWRVGRALAAGWSIALVSLTLAGAANLYLQAQLPDRLAAVDAPRRFAAIDATLAQARALDEQVKTLPVAAEEMDAVVRLASQLQQRHVDAPRALRWIGAALGGDPAVTIEEVSWEPAQVLGPGAGGPRSPGTGTVAAVAPAPVPAGAGADGATIASPALVRIAGAVDPSLTKVEANDRIATLLARLEAGCDCRGHVLAAPYDPSMAVPYSASLRDTDKPPVPHFSIEIERPAATAAETARVLSQVEASPHG